MYAVNTLVPMTWKVTSPEQESRESFWKCAANYLLYVVIVMANWQKCSHTLQQWRIERVFASRIP